MEHVPVLATELIDLIAVRPGDIVVDGTFGAGGHARLITAQMAGSGTYIGVDRDPGAAARFAAFAAEQSGITTRFVAATFPDAFAALHAESVSANVVILDIGVSSMQIDEPQRGFSYMADGPLDMRMDPSTGTGADMLVNEGSADEIARVLREYGEEPSAWRIAQAIVVARDLEPITTTRQLANIIYEASPAAARAGRGHPAKRSFQALRIAVNDELGMIDRGLDAALELLAPG
ncbi:MAG: 16S rRNA (cytosine(1402)-N(4))-methyltransferase RsmH, partial [Thermoleophilia bacterium]|nr:16S rRNA (cytosine(1402)-N(4))-methyltransferase RsmH [Thermoleophilia bacterium]